MHQTRQDRAQSIHSSDTRTWRRVQCQLWEFFLLMRNVSGLYQWDIYYSIYRYYVNSHQTGCWWQFCRLQNSTLAHHVCNTVKLTAAARTLNFILLTWVVWDLSDSHSSRNVTRINYVVCIQHLWPLFATVFQNRRLFRVTGSHVQCKSGSI